MRILFCMLLSLLVLVSILPPVAHAETKEIIAVGTYTMGEGESLRPAEERALMDAKRLAIEQAGTYLESYSKIMNLELTQDEVKVLVPGIINFSIIETNKAFVGDGIKFTAQIKALISTDKMDEVRKQIRAKALKKQTEFNEEIKNMLHDYETLQGDYARQEQDIKMLKEQLTKMVSIPDKQKMVARITLNEQMFEATMWVSKGNQYRLAGDYDEAIAAYNNAIKSSPDNVQAYNQRGICYLEKGLYDKAIDDFTVAFKHNPLLAEVLHNRSLAYLRKGEKAKADADMSSALYVNPLPPDVTITPPGPEIPWDAAAFSGKWYGQWDSNHPGTNFIIVESIDYFGVTLVQARAGDPWHKPIWCRVRGRIADNVLMWKNSWGGHPSLTMQPDGTLLGVAVPQHGRNQHGVFVRVKE